MAKKMVGTNLTLMEKQALLVVNLYQKMVQAIPM
ncbi:hypothetical protein protein [Bacillus cereus G9241]|nr:hypothetical protein protein [Bacillus cereus G9241]